MGLRFKNQGSSINDVTVWCQVFCDDSIKALVTKRVTIGGGGGGKKLRDVIYGQPLMVE